MKIKKITPKHYSEPKTIYKSGQKQSSNYYMSEGDYAAFQMRIAAVLSKDDNLKKAFVEYGDVHSMTANAVFCPAMDVREFISKKKEKPYKTWRNLAKGVNFQFLFGGSAWSFAEDILKMQWNDKECLEFLDLMGLRTDTEHPYLDAAEYIRNSYFSQYPKLAEWHELCHNEAKETGCARSAHGARRLLPRLLYIGKDTDKKIVSDDLNISKNSPVQNFESTSIMRSMREFYYWAKENNYKSRIFGMIHDAVVFYIHKDELDVVAPKVLEIFQKDQDEFKGVTMEFELEISDINKGEVWGFGREIK